MKYKVIEKVKEIIICKESPKLKQQKKLTVVITDVSDLCFRVNNLPSHPTFYSQENSIYLPAKYFSFAIRILLTYAGTYINEGCLIWKIEQNTYTYQENVVYPLFWCKKAEELTDTSLFPVLFLIIINIKGSNKELIVFPHLYENSYLILKCPICGDITKRQITKTVVKKTTKTKFTLKNTLHKCANKVYKPNNVIMDFLGFYIKDLFIDFIPAKKYSNKLLVSPYISTPFYKEIENLDTKFAISKVKYLAYRNENLPNKYLAIKNKNFGDMLLPANNLLLTRINKYNNLLNFKKLLV